MALTTTWPLTSDGAGAVEFTANQWRTIVTELWDEGVLGLTSFVVTERSGGANMRLDISGGRGVIEGDNASFQGNYMVRNDAPTSEAVTIPTADPSNPRHDLVGIQLNDPSEGGAAGRESVFVVVSGTAAASPVDPAVPDSFLLLYRVVVPAGASSIVNANLQDLRVIAGRRDVPGALMDTAGSRAISGWIPRDGRAVSRSEFAALFAAIGTTYGAGNGSTTFNVPDSRGRKLSNANDLGSSAGAATGNSRIVAALGANGGTATHTLTTPEMPSHTHTQNSHNHTQNSHNHTQNSHNHSSGSLSTGSAGSHSHDANDLLSNTRWLWSSTSFHSSTSAAHTTFRVALGDDVQLIRGTTAGAISPQAAGSHTHAVSGSTSNATATNNSATATNNGTTATNNNTGGGNAHPNTDPYLAVYGWIRT